MLAARAKAYAKWALAPARDYLDFRRLPVAAKEAVRADAAGPPQLIRAPKRPLRRPWTGSGARRISRAATMAGLRGITA